VNPSLPIGIFDSGVGGLTVAREIHRVLPREDLIYLGDTARVPYGTKGPTTVTRFACEDAQFLVQQNVKAIVVACNTVSAWAMPALERRFSVPVFGVVVPGVLAALEKSRTGRIGVIGTGATIRSKSYENGIRARSDTARVYSQACPLLVPLVEAGWMRHEITARVLAVYLKPLLRHRVDTLVLGCTHYPLLKPAIRRLTGKGVALVDSAESCARHVREKLESARLLNPQQKKGTIQPFLTDETDGFERIATRFLGAPVEQVWKVELPPLSA
jgi:glutamate racemase